MTIRRTLVALVALMVACSPPPSSAVAQQVPTDRSVLPIQVPEPATYTELDVRNVEPPPHFEVTAPEGAPNILLVLVDDLGFAGRHQKKCARRRHSISARPISHASRSGGDAASAAAGRCVRPIASLAVHNISMRRSSSPRYAGGRSRKPTPTARSM